jgi:hypothetical protein
VVLPSVESTGNKSIGIDLLPQLAPFTTRRLHTGSTWTLISRCGCVRCVPEMLRSDLKAHLTVNAAPGGLKRGYWQFTTLCRLLICCHSALHSAERSQLKRVEKKLYKKCRDRNATVLYSLGLICNFVGNSIFHHFLMLR